MIGKVIPKRKSSSIEHLNDYILNRNGAGEIGHKVLCSGTLNMLCGERGATLEMESVAMKNTHVKYPVMHCLLSWRAGEQPTEAQAREAVEITLSELDLQRHQCVWAMHQNTDNVHLHISVNRIDVVTHKPVNPAHGWTIRAMERAARRIEFSQGWQVEKGAWSTVDENGRIQEVPKVDASKLERKIPQKVKDVENLTGEKSAIRYAKDKLARFKPVSWSELHAKLAEHGMTYKRKGSGAVIFVGEQPIKASLAGKRFTLKELEKTIGSFEEQDAKVAKFDIKTPTSEPLSKKNDNETWQEYRDFRSTYYDRKKAVRAELTELIDLERAEMKVRHAREREETFGGQSWAGRGRELNIQRSILGAKHAQERLELKARHTALREDFKLQFDRVPTYEEWLRERKTHDDADEWRYRVDDKARRLFAVESGVDGMNSDMEIRDLRGFICTKGKRSIQFVDRSRGVVSFRDFGPRISVYEPDDSAMLASMQLGMAKWGSVKITGSMEYKLRCVTLASEHGIKITNPELQSEIGRLRKSQDVDKTKQSAQDSRVAELSDRFERYHDAVGADRYVVTATAISETGSKRGFQVNRRDGATEGFTASEVEDRIGRLVALQDEGRQIDITPISDNKHHIVIEGIDRDGLARMAADGYRPCAVIETSPNNFQAVITIPKLGNEYDREIADRIARELKWKYGDMKRSNASSSHILPGFECRDTKARISDGIFPEAKLVTSERGICEKTSARAKEIYKELSVRDAKILANISDISRLAPPDKAGSPTVKAFALHFADIYAASKKRERQTGITTSESRIDGMVAVRLRATGHSKDDVRDAIQILAPSLRHELGLDPNAHDWNDYAKRTVDYAFGKGGERDLAKLTVKMIDRYWQMEHPEYPKVEAKKRPLSLQEDKDRLKELTSLRDNYAEAYAAPIMDEAKQSVLDQVAAARAEAERALADAKAAVREHEETEVELTTWQRLFGGKEAERKIAAHEAKTEELKEAIRNCERALSALDKRERDPFDGKRSQKQTQLEDQAKATYDAQHPEELAERVMLTELIDLSARMEGYISNPVSQPTGHKHDAERVERIFEIEASRGLTHDEAHAKHPGVQKYYATVGKYLEKQRGKEVERGFER